MNFKTVLKNHPCRVCSGCLVLLGLAVILLVTLMTSSNKLGGNIILSIISVNHFCQAYPQSLNTNPRDWGWGWHPQHVPNFYHLLPLIYVLLIMFSSIMISLVLAVCLVRIWGGQIRGILPRFLAPTGAQEVTLSVRPSVRLSSDKLSRAVNLHLSESESNLAVREH